jgi:hypothetical protein
LFPDIRAGVCLLFQANRVTTEDLDRQFFQKMSIGMHKKEMGSSLDNR